MPLTSAGVPADHPEAGMPMTDLTVLATQWEPDAAQTEGWSAADLDGLLVSGDFEIHADDLRRAAAGLAARGYRHHRAPRRLRRPAGPKARR